MQILGTKATCTLKNIKQNGLIHLVKYWPKFHKEFSLHFYLPKKMEDLIVFSILHFLKITFALELHCWASMLDHLK